MAKAGAEIETYSITPTTSVMRSGCVIVGAGPAGLGPLIAAARKGKLQELLDHGVTIVEASASVGRGEIGRYAISSDSAAEAFLDAITETKCPELEALLDHPVAKEIAGKIGEAVSLQTVARFLELVGEQICAIVRASSRGQVLLLHRALETRQTGDGGWITRVRNEQFGTLIEIKSKSVVLATGAAQPVSRLYSETIAGQSLLPKYAGKVLQSGYALTSAGLKQARAELARYQDPKVVVVGGSASAGAVARVLLESKSRIPFGKGGVTVIHRRPMRIFYRSASDALADGYADFSAEDICPVSGRVYRLAGFRLQTRELMMRVLRVGGRKDEPRLTLHQVSGGNQAETRKLFDEAHLIIASMGYRPRALAVLDAAGRPIVLQCSTDEMLGMVNRSSEVLDYSCKRIAGLYGIGLAAGFVPSGSFGGEPSFRGQANSLWLWQHDVGEQIADAVLSRVSIRAISNAETFHGTDAPIYGGQERMIS